MESLAVQAAERSWTTSAAAISVFMGIVALGAIGWIVASWLRRPNVAENTPGSDPWQAGVLAIGYVSGAAVERWPAAGILRLAAAGVISIIDERTDHDAEGDERSSSAVRLRFEVDPDDPVARSRAGSVGWSLVLALFDGRPARGTQVEAAGSTDLARRIREVTVERFNAAARRYRKRAPDSPARVATFGGWFAVIGGFLAFAFGAAGSVGLGILAAALGAIALVLRPIVLRAMPLNAEGVELADRVRRSWQQIEHRPVTTAADMEQVLPWAVLFGDWGMVARLADVVERTRTVPGWYRPREAYSSARFASCMAVIGTEFSQPLRRTGTLPWAGDPTPAGGTTAGEASGSGVDGGAGWAGGDGGGADGGD